jgi:hypothetical protein
MPKCIALCKNGAPCRNNVKELDYCHAHYKIYEEKSLETTVEPITYDVIKKMPFPLDVSIKILNGANTKIDIDDKIKYKIPPSKLSINPFHEIKLNDMLSRRNYKYYDSYMKLWHLSIYKLNIAFDPINHNYIYAKSTIDQKFTYVDDWNYNYQLV